MPVPDDGGFSLVRNADTGDIGRRKAALVKSALQSLQLSVQNFFRIVLHPAGLWINLLEGQLRSRYDLCVFIKNDSSRTGGSLIESDYIFSHDTFLSVVVVSIIHEILR